MTTHMETPKHPFDDLIQDKLAAYTPPPSGGAKGMNWAALEQRLDTQEHRFDDQMRQALASLQPVYSAANWEKMAHRIDAAIDTPAPIDALVQNSLDNLTLREPDWSVLQQKLLQERTLQRRLHRIKFLEIAATLLLFIITTQYIINQAPTLITAVPPPSAAQPNTPISSPTEKTDAKNADLAIAATQQQHSATQTLKNAPARTSAPKQHTTKQLSSEKTTELSATALALTTTDARPTPPQRWSGVWDSAINADELGTTLLADHPAFMPPAEEVATHTLPQAHIESLQESLATLHADSIAAERALLATAFAPLLPCLPTSVNSLQNDDDDVLVAQAVKQKNKWSLSVAMTGASNLYQIVTPHDPTYNLPKTRNYVWGYSAGTIAALTWDKFSVETGGIYSAISYNPRTVREIFGSLVDGGYVSKKISNATINTLQIPLNVHYNFYNKGKWRAYAGAGASLQIVLLADYIKQQTQFGSPNIYALVEAQSNSLFDSKRFNTGILKGDDLSENRVWSANIAVGIERKISSRWSLFLRPTYQFELKNKGIGPFNDKINNFSLMTGIRVRV